MAKIKDIFSVFTKLRNPAPLLRDRLGMQRENYRIQTRDGIAAELRPRSGDRYGAFEILVRGDYSNLGQSLQLGDTVIDIGANIGCFSLLAAQRVGPSGRVIALEPEENTFNQLKRNIELNGFTNISPKRLAIGGENGSIDLNVGQIGLFNSIYGDVDGKKIGGQVQRVPLMTLERLMREEGINRCQYLKLDCEGAEYDILDAMSGDVAARIEQVTIEIHKVAGHQPADLVRRINELGFHLVNRQGVYFFRR